MPKVMKVLIVEDEPLLASTLGIGLRAERFTVVHAASGVDGLALACENDFDVIVLDIMLPGLNGYEVLRRMRSRDVWTPVLMLTAYDLPHLHATVRGSGANDLVQKPYDQQELLRRMTRLLAA